MKSANSSLANTCLWTIIRTAVLNYLRYQLAHCTPSKTHHHRTNNHLSNFNFHSESSFGHWHLLSTQTGDKNNSTQSQSCPWTKPPKIHLTTFTWHANHFRAKFLGYVYPSGFVEGIFVSWKLHRERVGFVVVGLAT